ncbi:MULTISPECIES: hypothetical protein [Halanaerobium]|uniref:Streptomycin adenylyltransferase n=1 Tax=Halanaerobium kushneri TaxID=56779 RepID=A0A1N6ZZP0_9FIRM|nr:MULTISPECIES: hypothetical protein [Halanaerobium]RCW60370.1 hypothetical protein DFR80_107109 [Halanaerobium sp. ST460_2HS_T2]SIR32248.1 hypothetical protein SAMN05421834_12036 [Halanaerobium kushneri]
MKLRDYHRFTKELSQNLKSEADVIGLLALGSMAEKDHDPDLWSDHDFSIIVKAGNQDKYIDKLFWLPEEYEAVFTYKEAANSRKIILKNMHLIEYAVFTLEDLKKLKINSYRLLIDKNGISDYIEEIKNETSRTSKLLTENKVLLGNLLTDLFIGIGRYKRGEKISAHYFIKEKGLKQLLLLIEKNIDNNEIDNLDNLDPFRRFEYNYPDLALMINQIIDAEIISAAENILEFLQAQLREVLDLSEQKTIKILNNYIKK